MSLRKVTESNDDHYGDHIRRCWIPTKPLNEEFKEYIVKNDRPHYNEEITQKLDAPAQGGPGEHHKHTQVKTDGECDQERERKTGTVGFKHIKTQIHICFLEQEIMEDEKQENVQERITSATCRITKGLQRH